MSELWELILHHTYAGTPGVIYDLSPERRCSGRVVGIRDDAFGKNGVTPGSGAIDFRAPTDMIRVPLSKSWTPLGGLRAEFLCSTDIARRGGYLLDGGSFTFYATGGNKWGGEFLTIDGGYNTFGMGGEGAVLPSSDWITVAFVYEQAGIEVAIDGAAVYSSSDYSSVPLLPPSRDVIIGNNDTGHAGIRGRIDELKIWRTTPDFLGSTFIDRPMDDDVARCWAEWLRTLTETLDRDPGCADQLTTQLHIAFSSLARDIRGITVQPELLSTFVNDYSSRWVDGRLDEIPAVLADFIAWMHRGGVRPESNAALQALYGSKCFQSIAETIGPMRCDPALTNMLDGVAPIP